MAEYIERELAVQAVVDTPCRMAIDKGKVIRAVEGVPLADVVEVVRCKDCKHCTIYRCRADNGIKQLKCKFGLDIGDENHYCSLGAKMDGKGGAE